jgi:hypothetical protein
VPEDVAGSTQMISSRVRRLRERAMHHQAVAALSHDLAISEQSSVGLTGLAGGSTTRAFKGGA